MYTTSKPNWHRLKDIDGNNRTANCSVCGLTVVHRKGKTKRGRPQWRCHAVYLRSSKAEYRKHKKNTCERCGFVPEHHSQLDVDHIDINKNNDSPNNFQTLCANCHRLKTAKERGLC